ncbi:MAG: hypothetical protein K0S29_565 [Gammaproteobacteria bacterium]|jgi:hypothetical protein|nr:hypothetical protein [Gammaproteobacteria bacterium]
MNQYLSNKAFWLKLSAVAVVLWLLISAAMFHFFSLMALFWFFVIGAGVLALTFNSVPYLYESLKQPAELEPFDQI